MNYEQQRVAESVECDDIPRGFWITFCVKPTEAQASVFLENLRAVWHVVAGWGRWCDEDVGDWPTDAAAVAALPEMIRNRLSSVPEFEIENWLNDLHDRNWTWWSSSENSEVCRITLSVESLPTPFWMLNFAIEQLGGQIVQTIRGWVKMT